MKKTVFLFLFVINSIVVFGQSSRVHISPDTVRITPPGKPKVYPGTGMASTNDIIQNLEKSGRFKIFLNALKKAGLIETFGSKGPITLLAPEDDAFEKIKGKMDTLLTPKHHFELVNLLTYQAMPGAITEKNIKKMIKSGKGKAALTTLSGNKITATLANGDVLLTDEFGNISNISKPNIKQLNGLIHITDNLLIPEYKQI